MTSRSLSEVDRITSRKCGRHLSITLVRVTRAECETYRESVLYGRSYRQEVTGDSSRIRLRLVVASYSDVKVGCVHLCMRIYAAKMDLYGVRWASP